MGVPVIVVDPQGDLELVRLFREESFPDPARLFTNREGRDGPTRPSLAKVGPAQAQEIVRTSLGAKPTTSEPELVLLPTWRFDLASKGDGHVRSLWIEGAFGSVFREAP